MKKFISILIIMVLVLSLSAFASSVRTFEASTKEELDEKVNSFIKGKTVKQISYTIGQTSNLATEFIFNVQNLQIVYSCMVLYEEDK